MEENWRDRARQALGRFTRLTEESAPAFEDALDRLFVACGWKVHIINNTDDLGICTVSWAHLADGGVPVIVVDVTGGASLPMPIRTPDFAPGLPSETAGAASYSIGADEIFVYIDHG